MSDDDNWLREWEVPIYEVIVRLIDHPADEKPPYEAWRVDLLEVESLEQLDLDTMHRIANALQSKDHGTVPFVFSQNRTYFNWGADASSQQLVVEVASNIAQLAAAGVVGNSVHDVLKAVVRELTAAARARSEWLSAPIEESEAAFRARWHVIEQFGLERDEDGSDRSSLDTVGVENRADGSWLVRLADHATGTRYEVELLDEDGLVVVGRTGWRED